MISICLSIDKQCNKGSLIKNILSHIPHRFRSLSIKLLTFKQSLFEKTSKINQKGSIESPKTPTKKFTDPNYNVIIIYSWTIVENNFAGAPK